MKKIILKAEFSTLPFGAFGMITLIILKKTLSCETMLVLKLFSL